MKIETRNFELRADDENSFVLTGRAVSYDHLSKDLGGFRERIMPGTFSRSLKSGKNVLCTLNHQAQSILLGCTKAGTLQLDDSDRGLDFRCQLDPQIGAHRDVYRSVKRGDLSECSFAFIKGKDSFDEAVEDGERFLRRTVTDADLRDVSVVCAPAYGDGATEVSARAADAAIDEANRKRCTEIGLALAAEEAADLQKRIEAANRAVAEDRRRGEIS